jgi:hypothetical protein
MIAAAGSLAMPALAHVGWLSPTHLKTSLLLDEVGSWLAFAAHAGVFTAAAGAVGLMVFTRRDV